MGVLELLYKDPLLVLLIFAIFFVVQRAVRAIFGSSRLPPGPLGLPFVGYLPFMAKEPAYKVFADLGEKYGDVFQVQLGWQRMVVLNSADMIEKAFKMDVFTGRPTDSRIMNTLKNAGEDAIVFVDGMKWKFNRKVGLRALSIFGTSRNARLEVTIHEALDWFMKKVEENGERPVEFMKLLVPLTGGVISSLCFGTPPNPDNPFFKQLTDTFDLMINQAETVAILEFFPFLQVFFKEKTKMFDIAVKDLIDQVVKQIHENLDTVDIENVTDILSGVEKAIQETPASERIGMGISENDMRRMIFDIFDGGFFTTAENLTWGLLLLAQNPDVQERLAIEVRDACGTTNYPTLSEDYEKLDFTKATFFEILRFGSNLALGVSHRALKNVEFEGYIIRQNVTVVPNVWAVHFDPKRFPNPQKFNPERFLVDGKFSRTDADKVMSFSVGKRRCIGESLAIQEIPIILAGIIQRFSVSLDPETGGDPVERSTMTITRSPGQHKLIFKERGV